MPSLKDIRNRIRSVNNTAKITNAMKLVSAAKFSRASHAVSASRPYTVAFEGMVRDVLQAAQEVESPLLDSRPEKKALVLLLSTDRGLCGGLNTNLFKKVFAWKQAKTKEGVELEFLNLGRKGLSFTRIRSLKSIEVREKFLDKINFSLALKVAAEISTHYLNKKYDRIYLAYNEFQSALTQVPKVQQLLPVSTEGAPKDNTQKKPSVYTVEPSLHEVVLSLVNKRIALNLLQAMLEAAASEHGSRMTAMDSATRNAKQVNRKLTLQYNRARQAAITKELIEITSGAEAL